jgi:hypothetical protein
MSPNIEDLRQACWHQFRESYNKLNTIFSDAVFRNGCVSVQAEQFLEGMNISSDVIVKGSPIKYICRCMDERCQQKMIPSERLEVNEVADLALPGMGSLLTFAELAKHAEVIIKKAVQKNVKHIELYSHEGCGAAALARPNFEKTTGKMDATDKEVEEYFGQRAYKIFCRVNEDGNFGINIAEPKYQTAEKMLHVQGSCCRDIHPALGIIISDFAGLDYDQKRASVHDMLLKSELPFFLVTDYGQEFDNHGPSFDINKSWRSTAREVELASNIIASDHGMGLNFNLPIIFLVNSKESKVRARELIKQIDDRLLQGGFRNTLKNPVHHHFAMIDFMDND